MTISKKFVYRKINGSGLLINTNSSNEIYLLDKISNIIFEEIEKETNYNLIEEKISLLFNVNKNIIRKDIEKIMEFFYNIGVIYGK